MIEPGVRYLPMVPLPSQPQAVSLEAAVDLTKKSDHWREDAVMEEPEDGGSDSDTDTAEAGPGTEQFGSFYHRLGSVCE